MDNDNFYEKLQADKERAMEYYGRQEEKREAQVLANKTYDSRDNKSFTHIKHEKTLFAKILIALGWIITIVGGGIFFLFPDFFEKSEVGTATLGFGVILILLPWLGKWMGYAFGIYLLFSFYDAGKTDAGFSVNNISFLIWVKTIAGLFLAFSIDGLLWKEKSRTTVK